MVDNASGEDGALKQPRCSWWTGGWVGTLGLKAGVPPPHTHTQFLAFAWGRNGELWMVLPVPLNLPEHSLTPRD